MLHVKNICQKLGVRNRVELWNLIKTEAEAAASRSGQPDPAAGALRVKPDAAKKIAST